MLLEVDDFSLSFRRYTGVVRQSAFGALHGLSFGLERGEVLALVGASGAGKSLLAHALFGILPPNAITTGTLRLHGEVLDDASLSRLRGKRMGLVPQSISHLDPLVRCGRQLAWAAQRAGRLLGRGEVDRILAGVSLDRAVANAFPHQLSGGMARRLMLAMATIGAPDLVVADEPTSGLDPENAQRILSDLRRLAVKGSGIMLITHDLAQALPFADRVAILESGRLLDIEPATAFAGDGVALRSGYARALWKAMPQNSFLGEDADHA